MKRIASLFLVAALGVGCKASLGSTAADDARATDVGTTIGATASLLPGAPAMNPIVGAVTELAEREYQRRKAAEDADGPDGLSLITQILGVIGAAGAGYLGLRGRRTTAHIDELYDETKALAVKTAAVPKPPNT